MPGLFERLFNPSRQPPLRPQDEETGVQEAVRQYRAGVNDLERSQTRMAAVSDTLADLVTFMEKQHAQGAS